MTDTTDTTTQTAHATWLDGAAPAALPAGTAFGVPFPRGAVASVAELRLTDASAEPLPAQFWPLATWPDGSLKWAGTAPGAAADGLRVVADRSLEAPEPVETVEVAESGDELVVSTGPLTARIPRRGAALVSELRHGGTVVARELRLVSLLQTSDPDDELRRDRAAYRSEVTSVTVEQRGPVRAVIRIAGEHRAEAGQHRYLPFIVRLYFTAGNDRVRLLHTMIWDGDARTEFLAGLGVRAAVPLRAAAHDRHVRFTGEGGGVFAEAVRGITGLRRDPGAEVRAAQIAGRATPPTSEWAPEVSGRLELVPRWGDYTLTQPTADGFAIRKRTAPGHGWIDAAAGGRASGLAYLGDTDGGFSLAVRDFWQSHPTRLDVRDASGEEGELTAWLYAPDAPPMDLRFYHDGLGQDDFATQLEGLEITYEDYEPGFGDPHGIARTHELGLRVYPATPGNAELAADAALVADPPRAVASPETVRAAGVFGDWNLPDTSTPESAELEGQLDAVFEFYRGQVEQRHWYGFWNYGDVMHTYDRDRHVWRYDVGGYAWDNSELSPDLWLWYAFLRSGRKDVFRLAEAMTRHTGEVDVFHLGRFAGLGSRHNVQHWGCSAKQLRISNPAYRRFFHYLTADERTGELLDELRDSDRTFLALDPTRKVRADAATYRPDPHAVAVGLGTDWGALAATWLTAWERHGDTWSRDRLLGTMADIGALPYGFLTGEALYDLETGRFDTARSRIAISHLNAIFGLVEVCSELVSLVDDPAFEAAWLQYCRLYLADERTQRESVGVPLTGTNLTQAHSRLLAWAANRLGDDELARAAWRAFDASGEFLARGDFHDADAVLRVHTVRPPEVLAPVDEADRVSTNAAAQFGLAAIQNLALVGDAIAARRGDRPGNTNTQSKEKDS
jgi:hypothetical protein